MSEFAYACWICGNSIPVLHLSLPRHLPCGECMTALRAMLSAHDRKNTGDGLVQSVERSPSQPAPASEEAHGQVRDLRPSPASPAQPAPASERWTAEQVEIVKAIANQVRAADRLEAAWSFGSVKALNLALCDEVARVAPKFVGPVRLPKRVDEPTPHVAGPIWAREVNNMLDACAAALRAQGFEVAL